MLLKPSYTAQDSTKSEDKEEKELTMENVE